MQLQSPLPSKDGKKLFVVGMMFRGELTAVDVKTGKPSLFLGGISADWIDAATRKAGCLCFVSTGRPVEEQRGRIKSRAVDVWSGQAGAAAVVAGQPDNFFFEFPTGPSKPGKMYEIPASGGTPHELIPDDKQNEQDATWSADGKRVAFAGDANDAIVQNSSPAIKILDLQTGKVSPMAGSQGVFRRAGPPDGRYLAAMTSDSSKLMLFDFQTSTWKQIGSGTLSWLNWSPDGKSIYVKDLAGQRFN